MIQKLGTFVGLCLLIAAGGCALCDNSWDDAYNAYGGALQRQDRFRGRVGSVLSDPQMQWQESGGTSTEPTEIDLYPEGLQETASPDL